MEKHSFLTDFGGKGILEQKRWVVKAWWAWRPWQW